MSKMEPFAEHFWDHVYKHPGDGCWEWMNCTSHGYGLIWFRGGPRRAHRVSWILSVGEIPEELCVLHHCDNRICVRLDHLYLGNYKDNARDREQRDRIVHPKWEDHGRSKLSIGDVRKIRNLRESGLTYSSIVKQFPSVTLSTIAFICQRRTWDCV